LNSRKVLGLVVEVERDERIIQLGSMVEKVLIGHLFRLNFLSIAMNELWSFVRQINNRWCTQIWSCFSF